MHHGGGADRRHRAQRVAAAHRVPGVGGPVGGDPGVRRDLGQHLDLRRGRRAARPGGGSACGAASERVWSMDSGGSGSQSRQETTTYVQGAVGVVQHPARARISGPVPRGAPVLVHRQDGQRLDTATPTWTRTWSGRWAAGWRRSDRAAKAPCMPSCSARWCAWAVSVVPRPPALQRCLAGRPGGWTGSHGRGHARHHQSTSTGSRSSRRWSVVDSWYQRTSCGVASCS